MDIAPLTASELMCKEDFVDATLLHDDMREEHVCNGGGRVKDSMT